MTFGEWLLDAGSALAIAVVLAAIGEALVEGYIKPLWERAGRDPFYLRYITAGPCALLVLLSGQNLLMDAFPPDLQPVGAVVTALLAGLGSSWLQDFFTKRAAAKKEAS